MVQVLEPDLGLNCRLNFIPGDCRVGIPRRTVVQLADAEVEEGDVEQYQFRLIFLAATQDLAYTWSCKKISC